MTAAEAVWYALARLHQSKPAQEAFDRREVVRTAIELGYWRRRRETLAQHLTQWVNAQSPSESARAAYVISLGRGGPYRLVKQGDAFAPHREHLDRHPDPGADPERKAAVDWYTARYATGGQPRQAPRESLAVEPETAAQVRRYAQVNGLDVSATATLLLQAALKTHRKKDPMLQIVGIAEGDEEGGERHDEALYG